MISRNRIECSDDRELARAGLRPVGIWRPAVAWVMMSLSVCAADGPKTFCNPLPLVDYPVGLCCRGVTNGSPARYYSKTPEHLQYRELADPTLLCENGSWYLFPSCDQCWRSDDSGATWRHIPLGLAGVGKATADGLGYAPTVVRHGRRFLLMGSKNILFSADSPEGPWARLGEIELPRNDGAPGMTDPALFADEDGRLYLYWGCTPTNGIWGCELDAANPVRALTAARKLLAYEPEKCPWETLPSTAGTDRRAG